MPASPLAADSGPAGITRPYAEYCLAVFALHVGAATGSPLGLRRVTFTHRRPPDIREHERIFGCPVHFEAEHNRLYLDGASWNAPSRCGGDAGMLGVLLDHADLLVARLPRDPDLVDRARRAIAARLRVGWSLHNFLRFKYQLAITLQPFFFQNLSRIF